MKLTGKVCAFRIAMGFFMLLALAGYAFGQDATIVGTILDPSNAAVPAVTVTVTNSDTGQVRHVTSNDVGQYVVPDLQIGHYTIRAEAPGFKAAEQKDIKLNVADRARVDFKLEVGSTQESVNVEATAVAVQSESG